MHNRNEMAVTNYRRANGSQAQSIKPRVKRAPKVFPLAKTPSQEARKAANVARRAMVEG